MDISLYKDEIPLPTTTERSEPQPEVKGIENDYPAFRDACLSLEQDAQIEKPFVEHFVELFQDSSLDISPFLESNFPNLLFSLLLQFSRDNIDNPDIIVLLQGFHIILKYLDELKSDDLIFLVLFSLTYSNNPEIQCLSLQCLLAFSSKNLMNKYFIRNFIPNSEYNHKIISEDEDSTEFQEEEEELSSQNELQPSTEQPTPIVEIFQKLPIKTDNYFLSIRSLIIESPEEDIDDYQCIEIIKDTPIENIIPLLPNPLPIDTQLPIEMIKILPLDAIIRIEPLSNSEVSTETHYISHQIYIEHLYQIFLNGLLENSPLSNCIRFTILEIFSTFKNNIEQEIVDQIAQKLLSIVDQSELCATQALAIIDHFFDSIKNHTTTFLEKGLNKYKPESNGIEIIQNRLNLFQLKFIEIMGKINQKLDFLHELFQSNRERLNALESFKENLGNKIFSFNEFYSFLTTNWPDPPQSEVFEIEQLGKQYKDVISGEELIMKIFYQFSKESTNFYQFLDAKFILKCFQEFNFSEGSELLIHSLQFINEALVNWIDFRNIFFEDMSSIPSLLNISLTSPYRVKIEATILFTNLFQLDHDNIFNPMLVEKGVIKRIAELFLEIQDNNLYNKMIQVLRSIINRNLTEIVAEDLESINEVLEDISANTEDPKLAKLADNLIQKIKPIIEPEE